MPNVMAADRVHVNNFFNKSCPHLSKFPCVSSVAATRLFIRFDNIYTAFYKRTAGTHTGRIPDSSFPKHRYPITDADSPDPL